MVKGAWMVKGVCMAKGVHGEERGMHGKGGGICGVRRDMEI